MTLDLSKGVKFAVSWLHKRAEEMNDPHAKAILNSAAFSLGQQNASGRVELEATAPSGQAPLEGVAETVARAIDPLAWVVPDDDYPAERSRREAKQHTSLQQAHRAIAALLPASTEPVAFHPDILAAHAQFGGDLEDMQRRYDTEPVAWQWRVMFDEGSARENEWCDWHLTSRAHFNRVNTQIEGGKKRTETRALYASPPASGAVEAGWPQECATEGCSRAAAVYFQRGGVGSHHCCECYLKIHALPAAPIPEGK